MEEELASFHKFDTWDLTSLDNVRNIVKCKWIFRIKYTKKGAIERYKARLVTNGFQQRPEIEFS